MSALGSRYNTNAGIYRRPGANKPNTNSEELRVSAPPVSQQIFLPSVLLQRVAPPLYQELPHHTHHADLPDQLELQPHLPQQLQQAGWVWRAGTEGELL